MKKLVAILIIAGMITTNVSFAMAKGNSQGKGKDQIQTQDLIEDAQVTEEASVEEASVEEASVEEVSAEEATVEEVTTEEASTKEEIKNKMREIKAEFKTAKEQVEAVKEQFIQTRNDKEAKQELLSEIARLKREAKDSSIGVFVSGKDVKFDVPPVIKAGRTLIPVRAVVNALGASVAWDEINGIVTVTKAVYGTDDSAMVIELKVDSNIAKVNGEDVELDTAAEINSSRTFVPLRFIAETFGLKVDWDGDSSTVIVEEESTNEETASSEAVEQEDDGTVNEEEDNSSIDVTDQED